MRHRRLESSRELRVDAPPSEVWSALERVDDYPTWWPWLRRFEAESLTAGQRWCCRIRPPLPWTLRVEVDLRSVDAPRRVRAVVSGDVEGWATLSVAPTSGGSEIRLRSSLSARRGPTRVLHDLAPALSRRAHDQVVDAGLAQFRDRAL